MPRTMDEVQPQERAALGSRLHRQRIRRLSDHHRLPRWWRLLVDTILAALLPSGQARRTRRGRSGLRRHG